MANRRKKNKSTTKFAINNGVAWIAFCVLISLCPLVASTGGHSFMIIYLPIILLAFSFVYCLFHYGVNHGTNQKITWTYSSHWLFWAITVLLVWGFLSSFWATNKYLSFEIGLRWFCGWLSLILVVQLIQNKISGINFYQWIAVITLPLVLLGIGQHLFDVDLVSQPAAPASTFKNKNIFSQYLIIAAPLITAVYLQETMRLKQWLFGLIATLSLVMIIYAKTRAAWLAVGFQLILVSIALAFLRPVRRSHLNLNRGVQLISFGLLFLLMIHFNKNGFNANAILDLSSETQRIVTEANTERENGSIRLVNWLNTLIMFKEHWLTGVGLGNWQVEYPLYKSRTIQDWVAVSNVIWNYTHNDYLETLSSLGAVGGVILGAMFIGLLMLVKALPTSTNPVIHLGALLALAGLGVTAVFSFPLQLIHSIVYAFCLVGILLAGNKATRTITIKKALFTTLLLINLILLITVSYLGYSKYQARDAYRQSGKYLRRNDYSTMLIHANKAYKWIPWTKEVLEVKGIAESQLQHREQATQTYRRYLELYPNTVTALENGTISLIHTGQYAEAMTAVQRLLTIEPNSVIGNINMGTLLYHKKGNYKPQAIQFYQRALQLKPNHPMKSAIVEIINKEISKQ